MQEVTGVLQMLGSGVVSRNTVGKSFVQFDTLEIGGKVLQKLRTARSLEDFLSRGLGDQVTLYLVGNFIVGVTLADGKTYYWSRSKTTVVLVVLCGAIGGTMLFGGFASVGGLKAGMLGLIGYWGLLYASFRNELNHIFSAQPKLAAMGGQPLRS